MTTSPIAVPHGQCAKDDRVQNTEDGGIDAHAEAEREYDRCAKDWGPSQQPHREHEVIPELVDNPRLQLNEIVVSDLGTLWGLTQFPRTAVLVGVKPLDANEIE